MTTTGLRYCYWGIGHWSLATGYWLLAIGYWLLATGNWQLATGYETYNLWVLLMPSPS